MDDTTDNIITLESELELMSLLGCSDDAKEMIRTMELEKEYA